MTFNDVMSKLVTSRPEHSGQRVEFKLNAIRNLVNKGYVIVCPTEVKLKDEKTFLAPYGVIPNYYLRVISTKLLLRSYLNRCAKS
jgi:hypothetical protein